MKKLKNIYISILLSVLTAFAGFALTSFAPQKNVVFAQSTNLPANATFRKYTKEGNEYTQLPNTSIFHQDAVFVEAGQVVIFEIGNPDSFPNDPITDIVVDVYLNSVSIGNGGAEITQQQDSLNESLKLILDPYSSEELAEEGKYQINLEYFDKNVVKQILQQTFYLYKESTYKTNKLPAVSTQNFNHTAPATEAASYARTHEFRYTNDYTSAQNLVLPTITFDSSKFEVAISKNHSGTTQHTYISLDNNDNLTQTLPLVLVKKEANNVVVTFNNLGSYTVNYYMLYKSEGEKFLFANLNANLKPDRVQVFGFQIYHSNINATTTAQQQQEFKVITENNTIDSKYQTDITFTQIQKRFENTINNTPNNDLYTYDSITDKYILNNIDTRVLFKNTVSAQSTNQAPVSFQYNATLNVSNIDLTTLTSENQNSSFYFKLSDKNTDNQNTWTLHKYDGSSFSDVGTYLLKLTYSSDLSTTKSTLFTQWFYFTISNQIPNHTVKAGGEQLSTGSFTKEVVEVAFMQAYNPFNSASRLRVYRQETLQSASTLVKEVEYNATSTFSQDGIYTVELSRGRNYQSKNTSQFIIDTTPITGLVARDVRNVNNTLTKGSASGFYTNQSVAVEWNKKDTNGNTVSGFYKYIPLKQLEPVTNHKTFYNDYYPQGEYIPVQYGLNYEPSSTNTYPGLSTIPYSNTLNASLSTANTFSQEGLYLIRAVDKAGNEAYTYFFIDKTTPLILQIDASDEYLTDYSKLNIVSETVTLRWGNYKAIKTFLNLDGLDLDTWLKPGETNTNLDPWLFIMLKEKANYTQIGNADGDFKKITYEGKINLYLTPKIDADNIMVAVGNDPLVRLTANLSYPGLKRVGNHSAEISATTTLNGILRDIGTSYTFHINDESNKNTTPSAIYHIDTSTDVSKTQVVFTEDDKKLALTTHNYRVEDASQSTLYSYYMPINTDKLQLQFLTTTDESSIEIETVFVYYYPYISNYLIYNGNNSMLNKGSFYTMDENILYTGDATGTLIKNETYTLQELIDEEIFNLNHFTVGKSLVLAKTPIEIEVYNYNKGVNLASNENEIWIWDIQFEEIYVDNISQNQTMAGKYEVVRKYKEQDNTSSTLTNKADYLTRHLTFIIEREDVISKGIDKEIDDTYQTFSLVGGSAYIEILAGEDNSQKFTALYTARTFGQQETVLISTNKLPVSLRFPVAKFGQVLGNNFNLLANNFFYANNINAYINSFEMGLRITHVNSNEVVSSNLKTTISATRPTNQVSIQLDNGLYLIFEDATEDGYLTLPKNFTKAGKYKVEFFQQNTALRGKTSSMPLFFEIQEIAPNFDIIDEYGKILPKHDTEDIFYANQNIIRVIWTDSTNPYLAKINKNEITYRINNGQLQKIAPNNIITQTDGITHFFEIPKTALVEGAEIVVSMQYEGKSVNYSPTHFSKSKSIIIDKTAPTVSINNLIAKMGDSSLFNITSLREGHNAPLRYNRTITTGMFADFAFAVDKASLESLILNSIGQETSALYYKEIENKYGGVVVKEYDPSLPDALSQIINNFIPYHNAETNPFKANYYYEIAEVDKAGNISIYTIYFTDIAETIEKELEEDNSTTPIITYTNLKEDDIDERSETALSVANQNYNLKIYAKQFFNLNSINPYGYKWYLLTFGTNKYLANPFLENQVYKISGGVWTPVSLKNEINLSVTRSNYVFELKNIPSQNISINIVVSNNELLFQTPQADNTTLTIISTKANDTEYVQWKSVSIWEYQNANISAFAEFSPSSTEPINKHPELEGFNLATYTINGLSTIFNINTKNQAYYRFKIVDNFGKEYVMYYLAGTQFVNQIEEIEGRPLATDNTFDATTYYISNTGFKYTYYPAITDSVEIEILVFDISKQIYERKGTYTITNLPSNYGTINSFANYRTINLRPNLEQSDIYYGSAVIYNITSKTLASENIDADPYYETAETHFKVYSLVSQTVLTGKNRQDLSDILLKYEGIISEPITIEFASTSTFDYPVKVFLSYNNQTETQLESGQVFSQPGNYTLRKVFTGAMSIYSNVVETFIISDEASTFFTIVQFDQTLNKYVDVKQTAQPYLIERPLGFDQTLITQHYIVNTTEWKINKSDSQFMEIVDNEGILASYSEVKKNGVTTFIQTLSNTHIKSENKSFTFYKTVVAITYIPKQSKLLTNFYYLDNQASHINLIDSKLPGSERTYTLEKGKDLSDKVEIYWNNYHLIPENKISAKIYFGQDMQELSSSSIKTRGNNDYIILTRSGNYSFVFTDQAGNVHKFDFNSQLPESTSAYQFIFLNSVIFTVNDQAPIQHAIYNQEVVIKIPSYTISYYDNNARPEILVMKDNKVTTDYSKNSSERSYTFTKSGLYKVTFSAKISTTSSAGITTTKEVREQPFIFEIIKENEIAEVFNVAQFGDYHIEKIEKNNIDVTNILSNASLGNIVLVQKDGQTIQRLKNILISLHDEQTGAGAWKITINTNNDLNQSFSFNFTISDTNPPIVISHPLGAETRDVITVSFNARNLYQNVGESTIKIGTREIHLNEEYFEGDYIETHNIEITSIGDTYVQIFTPSGRLVYTYKVTRLQPLNTVAVIVIVISSLAVAGLIVLFVLLRRRMKIR